MRLTNFLTAAGLTQVGLALSIPSLGHRRFHNQKRDSAAPVVETVTITFYRTVIWVNRNGQPLSTQINTPLAGEMATSPPQPTVPHPQSSNDPLNNPSNVASAYVTEKKPGPGQVQFSRPATATASQPPSSPYASQSSVSASSQSNDGSGEISPQAGRSGLSHEGNAAPGGMGICYDMINSQTQCKELGTINSEFSFLRSQGYGMIRIYDIGCDIRPFIAAAGQNGLKLMVGINAIANLQGDLGKLVSMVSGNWASVDTVYIGNELVNSGQASAGEVAVAVSSARGILKGAGFSGSVITVDTFNSMMSDGTICSTSDYCGANAHAFFDPNTSAQNASNFVRNAYNQVASANQGKRIVITESGWPWKGPCNGRACPSVDNQKAAINSIMGAFSEQARNIFLFQAYDAGYKQPGPYGVEPYFGIYDSDHYPAGIGSS